MPKTQYFNGQEYRISLREPSYIQAMADVLDGGYGVSAFGVMGDGVHDDTAGLQAALDAVALTRGCLNIPRGTYKISNTLNVTAATGIVVQGDSMGGVLFQPTAAMTGLPVFKLTNCKLCVFRGFRIGGVQYTYSSCAIQLHSANVGNSSGSNKFEDIWIGSDYIGHEHGVLMTCANGFDRDNDRHAFNNVRIENITGSCYRVTHANSLWHVVQGGQLLRAAVGFDIPTGNMRGVGIAMVNMSEWDFKIGTDVTLPQYHASTFTGVNSENNVPASGGGTLYVGEADAVSVKIAQYERTGGRNTAANMVDIRSSRGVVSFNQCKLDYGAVNQKLSVTGALAEVGFNDCELGFTHWIWGSGTSHLKMVNNKHNVSAVVETPDPTGRMFQMGDTGAGYYSGGIRAYGLGFSQSFDLVLNNMNGTVVFGAAETSKRIDFPIGLGLTGAGPYNDYKLAFTAGVATGTPAAGSLSPHVGLPVRDFFGFWIELDAAPGVGNSVRVDWFVTR